MRIFLAFPCYRPTPEQWEAFVRFVDAFTVRSRGEITYCVVDDGSPVFRPPEGLEKKVHFERLPQNRGKGAALRRAVEVMPDGYDVFAFLDFDLPYPPEDLAGICGAVFAGADVCIGSRTEARLVGYSDRLSRNVAHRLFRLFVRSIVVGSISDTQCGVKAYQAQAAKLIVEKSRVDGFLFDLEWLYIALHHNLCVRQWKVLIEGAHESSRLSSYRVRKLTGEFFSIVQRIFRKDYSSPALDHWRDKRRAEYTAKVLK